MSLRPYPGGEPRAAGEAIRTFTSSPERCAAELSGSYPPGFVWQRTSAGTVVEAGYVAPNGDWQSTAIAVEVADYAAAVALPDPQNGDEVTLLRQNQRHASGNLVYRSSVPGGDVGWWLPKAISNLKDFAYQNGIRTAFTTVNGGGTDTYTDLIAGGEWTDASPPGATVSDVGGDIQFDSVSARVLFFLPALTTLFSVGEKFIVLSRTSVSFFNPIAGNLACKIGVHDGEHTHNMSLTRGAIDQYGFVNDAGTTLTSGIDCSSFKRMISIFEVGPGGSLVSRGWAPDTGWTGPSIIAIEAGFNPDTALEFGVVTSDASIFGNRFIGRDLQMIRLKT